MNPMERRTGTETGKGSKISLNNDRLAVGIVIAKAEPILSRKGLGDNFFEILRVYRSVPSLELQAHVVRVIEKESAQGHGHGQTDTKGHPTDGLQGSGEVNGEARSENPVKNLELG
jgi:hypothetical protein